MADSTTAPDRGQGNTAPERGPQGQDVVGRPDSARNELPPDGFEPPESPEQEREAFNQKTAVEKGASFDGLGP